MGPFLISAGPGWGEEMNDVTLARVPHPGDTVFITAAPPAAWLPAPIWALGIQMGGADGQAQREGV